MLMADANFETDAAGIPIDSDINSYMKLLQGDIVRGYDPPCPKGHSNYPSAIIGLFVVKNERGEKIVDFEVKKSCCADFAQLLESNLKKEMNF